MLCTNCAAANPDGAQLCSACGQPLNTAWQAPASELVPAVDEIIYAGFWQRLAALILDSALVWPGIWAGVIAPSFVSRAAALWNVGGSGRQWATLVVTHFFPAFFVAGIYFMLMESGERGATLGKRALKLRVVDVKGGRISKGRALRRYLAHSLSGTALLIGFLIQPFTPRRQALHDLLAGTLVIQTENSGNRRAIGIVVVTVLVTVLVIAALVVGAGVLLYVLAASVSYRD